MVKIIINISFFIIYLASYSQKNRKFFYYIDKIGIDTVITINNQKISFSCVKVVHNENELNIYEYIAYGQEKRCSNDVFDEIPCDSLINNPKKYLWPYLRKFHILYDSVIKYPASFIAPYSDINRFPWMIYEQDSLQKICVIEQEELINYFSLDSSYYHVKYSLNDKGLKTSFLLPLKTIKINKYELELQRVINRMKYALIIYYLVDVSFSSFIWKDEFIIYKGLENIFMNEKKFYKLIKYYNKIEKMNKKHIKIIKEKSLKYIINHNYWNKIDNDLIDDYNDEIFYDSIIFHFYRKVNVLYYFSKERKKLSKKKLILLKNTTNF